MSFRDDFIYPTILHRDEMQKYRDFFNKLISCEVVTFGCSKYLTNGQLLFLSNRFEAIEFFVDTKAYTDSPFLTRNSPIGYKFVWNGYSDKNVNHDAYQLALHNTLGIDLTLIILERHFTYNQFFCFDLQVPKEKKLLPIQEMQAFVLKDFMDNMPLVTACINQFKTNFLTQKKLLDLFKINVSSNVHNISTTAKNLINKEKFKVAIETGILTQDDLSLKNVQLTVQEEACLNLYISGIAMHEVAEKLSLSPRTVEGYLSRSKEKFGVTSKGDLFQKFNKLKLIIEMNL